MRLSLFAIIALAVVPVSAEIVSYDGTAFPDDVGWIRLPQAKRILADRMIDDGYFVQSAEIIEGKPGNERDNYRWNLTEQAGAETWFLQWVMETDGPLFPGAVAPSSIAAAGKAGIVHRVIIGANELVFDRGSRFPLVFHAFEPGIHEFRIELQNDPPTGTYTFMVDGEVIDTGAAEGFYPTADSFVVFGCQAAGVDSVTKWDYIEFGDPTAAVPATSEWGYLILFFLLASTGTVLFRKRPVFHASL